jgi:hypothetical protein
MIFARFTTGGTPGMNNGCGDADAENVGDGRNRPSPTGR